MKILNFSAPLSRGAFAAYCVSHTILGLATNITVNQSAFRLPGDIAHIIFLLGIIVALLIAGNTAATSRRRSLDAGFSANISNVFAALSLVTIFLKPWPLIMLILLIWKPTANLNSK